MIHSMTGYASRQFSFSGQNYKIEVKSLNHRFLEVKLRTPREWTAFEAGLRTVIENKLKRGSVELWVEKLQDPGAVATDIRLNYEQAEAAHELFTALQHRFNLAEGISLRDLVTFPDVIIKGGSSMNEDAMGTLQPLLEKEVQLALDDLLKMRATEGVKLKTALLGITEQFKKTHGRLLEFRSQIQKKAQEKVKKRIEQCFEAYVTPDAQMRALMETRIAQEISYALDKLDIEEELTRFQGHVHQVENLLQQAGPVGKKLDFLFQELNREINTLGNKSQDLDVSQDVIQLKMWVEQMREQCLNLE